MKSRFHVNVCHIEAGLRSGDERMPEEINRLVTDHLSNLLLTPDKLSSENLRKEGVPKDKIRFVGNIMIDTLEANRFKAEQLNPETIIKDNLIEGQPLVISLTTQNSSLTTYALMTMHRPSNVDQKEILKPLFEFLANEVAEDMPLIWPIHPCSQERLKSFDLWEKALHTENLILLHPVDYHEMVFLNMDARIMLTDSGGLQA